MAARYTRRTSGVRVAHSRTTCDAVVGGQRVVLDVRSRTLHALRADAAAVWPLLDGSATLHELAHELADATMTPVGEARRMLDGWIVPLLEAGLLQVVIEPPA